MIGRTRNIIMPILVLLIIAVLCFGGCSNDSESADTYNTTSESNKSLNLAKPGEKVTTHIHCQENGKIAIRVDVPQEARFSKSAPVVVVASTWFVEKYTKDVIGFHLIYNPVDVGAITVTHLWPGKTDPETKIRSDGVYDYGGPNSLAALRDTIRFSLGEIPNIDGQYLHDLIETQPLYDNVGMFASSHAGVVATNVMAYHGESITGLEYFVGRENPTMAEMYPLEIGHFDDHQNPVCNPYYNHEGYTPTSIDVDYSHLGWIQNEDYPEGRPVFKVENGEDYILDNKGPTMEEKRYFSHALTQALMDNGVFTYESWPNDVAPPNITSNFWPYRTPIEKYEAIGEKLPDLKVLLPFASADHVQAAPDKPHIRQAYDGFKKRSGLWTRLNCDLSYVQSEIHESATLAEGFPDNDANTEPFDWYMEADSWGFAGKLAGETTARTIPLAGIAEMADRVQANNWDQNLASTIEIPEI